MHVYNLGRGTGVSVLDMIHEFSLATGRNLPYEIAPRRPGDVAVSVADPRAAACNLDWRPTRKLDAMCRDAWRFRQLHPNGYTDSPRRPKLKEY
jgi:UDP-glucose 4-epimerase